MRSPRSIELPQLGHLDALLARIHRSHRGDGVSCRAPGRGFYPAHLATLNQREKLRRSSDSTSPYVQGFLRLSMRAAIRRFLCCRFARRRLPPTGLEAAAGSRAHSIGFGGGGETAFGRANPSSRATIAYFVVRSPYGLALPDMAASALAPDPSSGRLLLGLSPRGRCADATC